MSTNGEAVVETKAKKAPAEIETVKLVAPGDREDGTLEDFVGRRKLNKSHYVDEAGDVWLRLAFRNGELRRLKLRPDLILKYAGHGGEQKFGDETAGLDDVDDMVEAIDQLHQRVNVQGEWTVKREGSGMSGTSTLIKALVEYKGKTVEEVRTFLSSLTQAQKLALRVNPKLEPIIKRIEAEKVSKGAKIDTDALLDQMEAAPTA